MKFGRILKLCGAKHSKARSFKYCHLVFKVVPLQLHHSTFSISVTFYNVCATIFCDTTFEHDSLSFFKNTGLHSELVYVR